MKITYSYVRQSWVEKQIQEGIFGITLISRVAGIPESTGKTWLRQATERLPAHKKMPREYERAIGILLLEKYPKHLSQIAKMVFTSPRLLQQWVAEDRNHWSTSDLREQTHAMTRHLRPCIDEYFGIDIDGRIYLLKGRWPDSTEFEQYFHEILNLILYFVLELESTYRFNKIASGSRGLSRYLSSEIDEGFPGLSRKTFTHVPMYGPHRYRYTTKNQLSSEKMNWENTRAYSSGSLSGVNFGGLYDPSISAIKRLCDFFALYGDDHAEVKVLEEIIELKEFLAGRNRNWTEARGKSYKNTQAKKHRAS